MSSSSSSSCLLFHGPGALDRALHEAQEAGRLVGIYGDESGLKTETAREAILMMSSVPVGDQHGTVVIGPMDIARPEATDALLKSLEEFDSEVVRPYLWALDAGSVSGTIRSRCLMRWCPASGDNIYDGDLEEAVREVVKASIRKDIAQVIERLQFFNPSKGSSQGEREERKAYRKMIPQVASKIIVENLSGEDTESSLRIWQQLRNVAVGNPSFNEVLRAFLLV